MTDGQPDPLLWDRARTPARRAEAHRWRTTAELTAMIAGLGAAMAQAFKAFREAFCPPMGTTTDGKDDQ